jgi:peptidoglycan/LPS O-acetylase OafA/YrhL
MNNYRPEIDGLRAWAVVPVILYHANFSFFSGGYIGVDIFFVISGYLITQIILKEISEDRFSILGFYDRRIRRIFPALIFMISVCIPFAWVWLLPYEVRNLAESASATLLFISNIYYWFNIGYFSESSTLMPLLHTWSLAVEEQFYIIYPIVLIFLCRTRMFWMVLLISTASVVSLLLAQLGGNFSFSPPYIEKNLSLFSQPSWASFYLPIGRAWELMAGALVAIYHHRRTPNFLLFQNIASIAGLLLILLSIFWFDTDTPFPSVYTTVPIIGTTLILAFASSNTWAAKILSTRLTVFIGLISYSSYLWHQPVFAFFRLKENSEPDVFIYTVLICLTFVIGYLSWRYIETPFRNKELISRNQIFSMAFISSTVLLIISYISIMQNGFLNRYPKMDRDLIRYTPSEHGEYVSARFMAQMYPSFQSLNKRKIMIIGDSYAQDFYNMVIENNFLQNDEIRTFYISVQCQMHLVDEDISAFISEQNLNLCMGPQRLASALPLINKADIIILASNWQSWSAARMPQTIKNLNLRDTQRLLIIGTKSFGDSRPESFLGLSTKERNALHNKIRIPENDLFEKNIPKNIFVNIQKIICGIDRNCPLFTPKGHLISYDGGHLTQEGASYIGKIIFQHPNLQEILKEKRNMVPKRGFEPPTY